jgi:hypothetical protein
MFILFKKQQQQKELGAMVHTYKAQASCSYSEGSPCSAQKN